MGLETRGLHHVTAIAADPQVTVDFYTAVVGARLVKLTVNFDAPDLYHLYFGDQAGTPGTIVTFFPFPGAARGRAGTGTTPSIGLSVAAEAFDERVELLAANGVAVSRPFERLGRRVAGFRDPDGLELELVETDAVPGAAFAFAIDGVTLCVETTSATERVLTDLLGYAVEETDGERRRFRSRAHGIAAHIDLQCAPGLLPASPGAGTIHHIAFRAVDDDELGAFREAVLSHGLSVTPVIDRQYFHSIYFREPGGVLFEVATDPPGFAVDEAPAMLGSALKLPPRFEPLRAHVERVLPPIRLPAQT